MKIYVFGNSDHDMDNIPFKILDKLKAEFPQIEFVIQDPIQDFLPDERDLIILDTAVGIPKVVLLEDLNKIENSPTVGIHDFDLGFNLKWMKKIGKIDSFKIIAVPNDLDLEKVLAQTKVLIQNLH